MIVISSIVRSDINSAVNTHAFKTHLQIHHDGLHQEEDDRVILPVDVGGGFTQFDAGNGCALCQLLATPMPSQSFPHTLYKQFLSQTWTGNAPLSRLQR